MFDTAEPPWSLIGWSTEEDTLLMHMQVPVGQRGSGRIPAAPAGEPPSRHVSNPGMHCRKPTLDSQGVPPPAHRPAPRHPHSCRSPTLDLIKTLTAHLLCLSLSRCSQLLVELPVPWTADGLAWSIQCCSHRLESHQRCSLAFTDYITSWVLQGVFSPAGQCQAAIAGQRGRLLELCQGPQPTSGKRHCLSRLALAGALGFRALCRLG